MLNTALAVPFVVVTTLFASHAGLERSLPKCDPNICTARQHSRCMHEGVMITIDSLAQIRNRFPWLFPLALVWIIHKSWKSGSDILCIMQ